MNGDYDAVQLSILQNINKTDNLILQLKATIDCLTLEIQNLKLENQRLNSLLEKPINII